MRDLGSSEALLWGDAAFQGFHPRLELVSVVEIRSRGGPDVLARNGGGRLHAQRHRLVGRQGAPVEDDVTAADLWKRKKFLKYLNLEMPHNHVLGA